MIEMEKLKRFYSAKPFRPYDVVIDDGRRFHIDFPFAVGWSEKSGRMVFALGNDDYETVLMSHVVDVEPAKQRKRATKKRRRAG